MKIVIVLEDQENEHVRIDCQPPLPQLAKIYQQGNASPAMIYAALAIGKIMADSNQIEKELQENQGTKLIDPSNPRFKMPSGIS